ncbi:phage protein, HK97 gp10 family [Moraxella cuniculi DSM 21768]|uniref:Phage protein, HK97 gp10 family n=1 Tax=Moraxella cuniculi DSM 21768 TaxID=1122245 RepID=A0A1N7G4F6_9GAMM|nr:HK97-gp10 family putative phage morphogenesis protein [Moraxella cuniculi]OOS03265.1 hypothetical protein B0189_09690 [Moraxella cuniculi]SIS07428.1 phage protein, HK97 gp10 family [Moraxella cuniculi DSM 21768]
MKLSVKVEGLDELDKKLGNLRKDLRGKSLYNSLMVASTPMYKQAKRQAPASDAAYRRYMSSGQGEATFRFSKNGKKLKGKRQRAKRGEGKFVIQQAGLLKKNIRRGRLNKNSTNKNRAAIGIGVNVSGKTGSSAFYWHMVEYGTKYHQAQPFLRPAFENNKEQAVERFKQQLDKNIKKATGG